MWDGGHMLQLSANLAVTCNNTPSCAAGGVNHTDVRDLAPTICAALQQWYLTHQKQGDVDVIVRVQ